MASGLEKRDKLRELLMLLKKRNKSYKDPWEGTLIANDCMATVTHELMPNPCEDKPQYFDELNKLVEDNRLDSETTIDMEENNHNDELEMSQMLFIQKLIMMWVTNYCNVYVAEKMKHVDDFLIKNEDFQEKWKEVYKRCNKIEIQLQALFGCESEELLNTNKMIKLFTKIASESDVFDEFKSMSLLLLKCRDLLNNTENKNQESIPKPYDVKQKYFEEFIKLIEEYKLASEAAMDLDENETNNESKTLCLTTGYQKKVMKWAANYCDFYATEDMKPLNDILIKNQVFYEIMNDLTELCNNLEKHVKKYSVYDGKKSKKIVGIKPEFKSSDDISKLSDLLQGESSDELEEEESEIDNAMNVKKMVKTEKIDPVTQRPITNPVYNKVCKHVYDNESIDMMFSDEDIIVCPHFGCTNNFFTKQDILFNLDTLDNYQK